MRPTTEQQFDALVAGAVGILVAVIVIAVVVIPQVNTITSERNNTLNYTSTNRYAATTDGIVEFTSLANTSTTLTLNTQYRVHLANKTVELLSAATNISDCGLGTNCNYFAKYFSIDASSRSVLVSAPVLLAVMIVIALAGMLLQTFRTR